MSPSLSWWGFLVNSAKPLPLQPEPPPLQPLCQPAQSPAFKAASAAPTSPASTPAHRPSLASLRLPSSLAFASVLASGRPRPALRGLSAGCARFARLRSLAALVRPAVGRWASVPRGWSGQPTRASGRQAGKAASVPAGWASVPAVRASVPAAWPSLQV